MDRGAAGLGLEAKPHLPSQKMTAAAMQIALKKGRR